MISDFKIFLVMLSETAEVWYIVGLTVTLRLFKGVATGEARGTMAPLLQFPNQKRSKSFIYKHQGY